MSLLRKLNLPNDIKKLSVNELDELALDLYHEMLELSKIRSIHFSSNLGVIELTISLLKVFNPLKDNIIFDVTHQTYIYKMLTKRLNKMKTIRTYQGLSGFQDPFESKYDKFSAGHAGTSLSAATGIYLGLSKSQQLNSDVVVIIGDASLSNGMALEALEANIDLKVPLIIIINDNNMSISQDVGSLHHILVNLQKNNTHPNFFEYMGYKYFGVIDGHNLYELIKVLDEAKKYKNKYQTSVIIHIKTIKGYRYKLDTNGSYHSYKFNTDSYDAIKNSTGYFINQELTKFYKTNKNFKIVSPSMTYNMGFSELMKVMKKNFIDLGIQEENAITIAAGISIKKKYYVIVNTYSTFLQRTYDQLMHDVARMKLPLTILLDRADLCGTNGATHTGIFDVSMLKTIPNTLITNPISNYQVWELLKYSIQNNKDQIFVIRYDTKQVNAKNELVEFINNLPIKFNEWQILKHHSNNKICFISSGTYYLKILDEFMNLPNISFINALFLNNYSINSLKWLFNQNFQTIIVYERLNEINTLANELEAYCFNNKINIKIIKMNYHGFIVHGENEKLDELYHMDLKTIKKYFDENLH